MLRYIRTCDICHRTDSFCTERKIYGIVHHLCYKHCDVPDEYFMKKRPITIWLKRRMMRWIRAFKEIM